MAYLDSQLNSKVDSLVRACKSGDKDMIKKRKAALLDAMEHLAERTHIAENKMTCVAAGRRGGEVTSERYGHYFYEEIGTKGGRTCRDRYGREFYQEIGEKGGRTTLKKYGKTFYSDIGVRGAWESARIRAEKKRKESLSSR